MPFNPDTLSAPFGLSYTRQPDRYPRIEQQLRPGARLTVLKHTLPTENHDPLSLSAGDIIETFTEAVMLGCLMCKAQRLPNPQVLLAEPVKRDPDNGVPVTYRYHRIAWLFQTNASHRPRCSYLHQAQRSSIPYLTMWTSPINNTSKSWPSVETQVFYETKTQRHQIHPEDVFLPKFSKVYVFARRLVVPEKRVEVQVQKFADKEERVSPNALIPLVKAAFHCQAINGAEYQFLINRLLPRAQVKGRTY